MPGPIRRWRPPPPPLLKPAKETAHYHTRDWLARRQRILTRDANVCASCGIVAAGRDAHVDHRLALEDGGDDTDANLQTLCSRCHGRKTHEEQRRRGFLR